MKQTILSFLLSLCVTLATANRQSFCVNQRTETNTMTNPVIFADIPDFNGQRFMLFNFATQQTGGKVDFDFFHVK